MITEPPRNALVRMAHRAASVGWCYDLSQFLAGAPVVRWRLREAFRYCTPGSRVLDIGGGTGAVARLLPEGCRYVCLDSEMPKLRRCRENVPAAQTLLADATQTPIQEHSADVITCMFVLHHLTDCQVSHVVDECRRVLKPDGYVIIVEPVWNHNRLPGRFLWWMDRGSFPRLPETLRASVEGAFRLVRWDSFSVFHEYIVAVGQNCR